jgi:hypothetical protein
LIRGKVFCLVLLVCLAVSFVSVFSFAPTVKADTGAALIVGLGSANYFIVMPNSTCYGLDSSGSTVTSGATASTVINTIFADMSAGQKVTFGHNTFAISASLTPLSNTYINATGATFTLNVGVSYLYNMNSPPTNVTVDGGIYQGASSGTQYCFRGWDASYITIKNVQNVTGFYGGGAVLYSGDGYGHDLIYNCTIGINNNAYAITFNDQTACTVTLCNITCGDLCSGIGIFCANGDCQDSVITNNTVNGWGTNVLWHGIYIDGTLNTTIAHNTLVSTGSATGSAIQCKALNTTIYDNYISCQSHGINWYRESSGNSDYNTPNNIKIYNNTLVGVSTTYYAFWFVPTGAASTNYPIYNSSIYNNSVSGWGGAMWIWGYQSNATLYNTYFAYNTITNCTYGVRGELSGSVYVNGLTLAYNSATSVSVNINSNLATGASNLFAYGNTPSNWGLSESPPPSYTASLSLTAPTEAQSFSVNYVAVSLSATTNGTISVYAYNLNSSGWVACSASFTLTSLVSNHYSLITRVTLTEGAVAYANVNFTISLTVADSYSLDVSVVSPANASYSSGSVTLIYNTATNGTGLAVVYSLNGAANISLSGNTTLTGLTNGSYVLVLYASINQGQTDSYSVSFSVAIPGGSGTVYYWINVVADGGSWTNPIGSIQYAAGSSINYAYYANAGYKISAIYVNGVSVPCDLVSGTISFSNIQHDYVVVVVSASAIPAASNVDLYGYQVSPMIWAFIVVGITIPIVVLSLYVGRRK